MGNSAETLNRAFYTLQAAAADGLRCPTNDQLGHNHSVLTNLCRDGRIRIEVYRNNFRRVWILTGPHAGKSTEAAPLVNGMAPDPYLVSDRSGTRRNGALVVPKSPNRPSMRFDKEG